ncbi:hypothetical protein JJQ51_16155 [Rhizobium sp. AG207R]|nr:hypothetical protein [Rhizobium sp. AG207R]
MVKLIAGICIYTALKLWRTDLSFRQYPYGPPDNWIKHRIAWWLYHAGINLERRAALNEEAGK